MFRLCLAIALLFLGGIAWAAGYDDFLRGYEAARVGRNAEAIAAYSAALKSGDLAAVYVPNAYLGRARALMATGQCAAAAGDLDAALKLRPSLAEALTLRAYANSCLGKTDAAFADLDALVLATPIPSAYATRGAFNWFEGHFALAAADYRSAVERVPQRVYDKRPGSYDLLWYALSAKRAGEFDTAFFAAKAGDLSSDDWPGPLLSFIAGKSSADSLRKSLAADKPDATVSRACEADFYSGEWLIAGGDVAAGKALLLGLSSKCAKQEMLLDAARRDLKRLP